MLVTQAGCHVEKIAHGDTTLVAQNVEIRLLALLATWISAVTAIGCCANLLDGRLKHKHPTTSGTDGGQCWIEVCLHCLRKEYVVQAPLLFQPVVIRKLIFLVERGVEVASRGGVWFERSKEIGRDTQQERESVLKFDRGVYSIPKLAIDALLYEPRLGEGLQWSHHSLRVS